MSGCQAMGTSSCRRRTAPESPSSLWTGSTRMCTRPVWVLARLGLEPERSHFLGDEIGEEQGTPLQRRCAIGWLPKTSNRRHGAPAILELEAAIKEFGPDFETII